MPEEPLSVSVCDGKYTFITRPDDWRIHVHRYGGPWLIIEEGHHAVLGLMYELREFLDKRDEGTPEDAAPTTIPPLGVPQGVGCFATKVRYQDGFDNASLKYHATLHEATGHCWDRYRLPMGDAAMYYVYGPDGRELKHLAGGKWHAPEPDDVEPDRYVPTALRGKPVREHVTYACAFERGDDYKVWTHYSTELTEMLERVPNPDLLLMNSAVIVRYNRDGTDEVLYRWHNKSWVREHSQR